MQRQVVIDCFPESVNRYLDGYAIVAVDVIRATTMAITAAALGRRCYCASTQNEVSELVRSLGDALVAGELAGDTPDGFDMNNSPAELVERTDNERPVVLLSSSGTRLVRNASAAVAAYLACFRNFKATARYIASRHEKIAVIGAGSRNEFREEDQMCCAWIAEHLLNSGFVPGNGPTLEVVQRWSGASPAACIVSNSVVYLRRTDQMRDFDFILDHVNDIDAVFTVNGQEVVMQPAKAVAAPLPPDLELAA